MATSTDILIIGAGPQGLALGTLLRERKTPFLILEARSSVAVQWEQHYDSLELFTPRRYSVLPGLPFPGDQDGYPGKDEFAQYLRSYAEHFALPIVFNARVMKLMKEGEEFIAETLSGTFRAPRVVIATGSAKANTPPYAHALNSAVVQLHSSAYKNRTQVPPGKVLVVGNGNSAGQIALELSETHPVTVALRELPKTIPRTILGQSFYWWGETLGTHRLPSNSLVGKAFARAKDMVVGTEFLRALKRGVLRVRPAVAGAHDRKILFSDGSEESYESIIWATGFTPDYGWIAIPDAFSRSGLAHHHGASAVPGLYFAGLRNQFTCVSHNICGAGATALGVLQLMEKRR